MKYNQIEATKELICKIETLYNQFIVENKDDIANGHVEADDFIILSDDYYDLLMDIAEESNPQIDFATVEQNIFDLVAKDRIRIYNLFAKQSIKK